MDTAPFTGIEVKLEDRVLIIRMNRIDKKNAITTAMYSAMSDALANAHSDANVRVVMLTGAANCFTAGNDLKDFLERPPNTHASPASVFVHEIAKAPKPLIAAVEGIAIGIGTTMLLHCDLVVAGKSARLHLPFVNLGLVPEAGSSFLLPALIGQRRAAHLLLLAEPIGAQTALEYGIVSSVVEDGTAFERAFEQARSIAAKPPQAVLATKRLLKAATAELVLEHMAAEGAEFTARLQSSEAKAAFAAFLGKGN